MQLTLCRHGQTEWNLKGLMQGHLDSPLTELGQQQAQALSSKLIPARFDRIISSDLGRCMSTAAGALGDAVEQLETSALLRERNFGVIQGLSLNEHPKWNSAFNQRFSQNRIDIEGSESASDVADRICTLLQALYQQGARDVLLFSHGEWIRTLMNLHYGHAPWSNASTLPGNGEMITLRQINPQILWGALNRAENQS